MKTQKTPLAPDFSEGVDRKLLKQVRDRFLSVNRGRLDNALQSLALRHQDMLRVLPFLFQINHPLLPGYVGPDAPYGISGYEPEKDVLSIARTFSQSFKYRHNRRHSAQIYSIFMMGSTGTLAHSESSDVDLWLCVAPSLSDDERTRLKEKAEKIDAWAGQSGLEAHTFLMDAEQFRAGDVGSSVDAESSGSAQHYLLLDEFYRTAILLAGRYPLWWIIPPSYEASYDETTQYLLTKRFIKASEVLDFGSALIIPKNELIGAGLWQLYKALEAPYKSVIKIMLAEAYAQELPALPTLSLEFKQAVYQGDLDIEQLDPYVLLYKRLEKYLSQTKEIKRLDLVRKCFYLKVGKRLSRQSASGSWQVKAMKKVVRSWAWGDKQFEYLDDRRNWRFDQVTQERQELVAELSNSYRFLSNYSRANNLQSSMTAEDLNVLGRKLYAMFQRKAGKIERVNPGIAPNLWEENLAIYHSSALPYAGEGQYWQLYRDLSSPADAAFHPILKKSASLMDLLCWLYFNGIVNRSTRLSFVPGEHKVSMYEVQQLITTLEQNYPLPMPEVSQANFIKASSVTRLSLYINVGFDPFVELAEQGVGQISDRTDPLSFSSHKINLIRTIDQVALNSWNESSVHRYAMGETLLQNLQAYLQLCFDQREECDCELTVHCFGQQRGELIAKRVLELFRDCRRAFFPDGQPFTPVRYVMEIGAEYYVFMQVDHQFRFLMARDESQLQQYLSQPVNQYAPIVLDKGALTENKVLRKALKHGHEHSIQFFYLREKESIQLVVRDEYGSLFHRTLALEDEKTFLSGIQHFMRVFLERREFSASLEGLGEPLFVTFYRLTEQQPGRLNIARVQSIPDVSMYELQVSVIAEAYDDLSIASATEEGRYDFSVGQQEFSAAEYGERQIEAMLHYLKRQSDYDETQPLKISDISYPIETARFNAQQGTNTLKVLQLYFTLQDKLHRLSGL